MDREYPVDEARLKIFLRLTGLCAIAFVRRFACLRRAAAYNSAFPIFQRFDIHHVAAVLHRFEEFIAGRRYLIEVASVDADRWRAYIVRIPGVPTALMPFYGRTPPEAAQHLRDWLSRAHARAASPTPAV